MFDLESDDGVVILTLDHGRANAMDSEFCAALAERLDALGRDPGRAVVITARGGIFSAGVDLPRLVGGGAGYVAEFLPALDRLLRTALTLPRPLVAAINGHAIAGGCLLACTADWRVMARVGGRIGVPELRVGVPFPPLPLEILRHRVRPGQADALLYGGETLDPDAAQAAGLVDAVVDAERLRATACERARALAEIPAELFALTKAMQQHALLGRVEELQRTFGERVCATWAAPRTLDAVGEYIARTLGKG